MTIDLRSQRTSQFLIEVLLCVSVPWIVCGDKSALEWLCMYMIWMVHTLGECFNLLACEFCPFLLSLIHLFHPDHTLWQQNSNSNIKQQNVSFTELTWASRKVSERSPWVICLKPPLIMGRYVPVIITWSPGLASLVTSPLDNGITDYMYNMCNFYSSIHNQLYPSYTYM